jgi:excinuclease UvrABC nuclease subunit
MQKSYALEFDGYWLEAGLGNLPAKSGIYGVYLCTYDKVQNTVSLRELIYVGEAANVRDRVGGHEKSVAWRAKLKSGELLCFNTALVAGESDRQRAEAAVIFKHKPCCNTTYVDAFPFDTTTVSISGKNALMQSSFMVQRTDAPAAKAMSGYSRRWP